MYITIQTEIELYDNRESILVNKNATKELKISKRFIKNFKQIKDEMKKHIESITSKKFDPQSAEAFPFDNLSLTYHNEKKEEHQMIHLTVKHENKKIEFPEYYLEEVEKRTGT